MLGNLKLRGGELPASLAEAVASGAIDAAFLLEMEGELTDLSVVRPLVDDSDVAWAARVEESLGARDGSLVGIVSSDPRLAAGVACAYASWVGDSGTDAVLVDGSLEAPTIDKPLREDGDEGLVDAIRFGVSPSSVARRTLARGVRLVTAGSHPLSLDAALEPSRLREFVEALSSRLVLLVLPRAYLELVAPALAGAVLVESDPARLKDASVVLRERAEGRVLAIHVARAAEMARHRRADELASQGSLAGVTTPPFGEDDTPRPEEADFQTLHAEEDVTPQPGETRLEAAPPEEDATPRPGETEPAVGAPAASPFLPDDVVAVTSAARRPERRSRAGIWIPLIVVLLAVALWAIFGQGGLPWTGRPEERLERIPRLSDGASTSDAGEDALVAADAEQEAALDSARPDDSGPASTVDQGASAPTADDGPPESVADDGRSAPTAGEATRRDGAVEGPGGAYTVYLSSHRLLSAAQWEADEAVALGIVAVVKEAELPESGLWHRVAVGGGFATLVEARNALDIVKELGYEGAWIGLTGREE